MKHRRHPVVPPTPDVPVTTTPSSGHLALVAKSTPALLRAVQACVDEGLSLFDLHLVVLPQAASPLPDGHPGVECEDGVVVAAVPLATAVAVATRLRAGGSSMPAEVESALAARLRAPRSDPMMMVYDGASVCMGYACSTFRANLRGPVFGRHAQARMGCLAECLAPAVRVAALADAPVVQIADVVYVVRAMASEDADHELSPEEFVSAQVSGRPVGARTTVEPRSALVGVKALEAWTETLRRPATPGCATMLLRAFGMAGLFEIPLAVARGGPTLCLGKVPGGKPS